MRSTLRKPWIVAVIVAACAFGAAKAELFSKAYAFKMGTTLQVGTEIPGGLRLDSVEFTPAKENGGTFAGPKAKVTISNLGEAALKVGVSIAITDEAGNLVGVASGGTKLFPLRTGREIVYSLPIDGVRSGLPNGTVFRISIEPIP